MNTLSIGTISSGTLRPQDLLPAYLFALEDCDQATATRYGMELVELGFGYSQCGVAFDDSDPAWDEYPDLINDIIDELADHLQEHAPEYCYIGALEGDGAEIGVWPDWDRIEMDEHDGELVRIDAGDEFPDPEPDGPGALLVVTDHGNATLYVRAPDANSEPPADEWRAAWAIV